MKKGLVLTAISLTTVTVISKFTGLFREISLAFLFGTSSEMDAYLVALIIPTILFESFGEALRLAFIPIITLYLDNPEKQWKFFNNIINFILVLTLTISIISAIFIPYIVQFMPLGFDSNHSKLVGSLAQITIFIIVFTSLTPISSGLLSLKNIYIYPELTGVFYNLAFITFAFAGKVFWGIKGLALGTVVAELMRFIFLLPSLYKEGFRYRFYLDFRNPELIKLLKLMKPIIFGNILSRLNILVERAIGSFLQPGSISALNYAKKLLIMCSGVVESFSVTMVFPMLSKYFAAGKLNSYRLLLMKVVRFLIIFLIPAVSGLIILREPIVKFLFLRGAFDQLALSMTSTSLFFYSFGILGLILQTVLQRCFLAMKDSSTPVINNSIGIVLNIILNLLLIRQLDYAGIALSASVSSIIASTLLLFNIYKRIGLLGINRTVELSFKVIFSSLIMSVAVYFLNQAVYPGEFLRLLISAVIGLITYTGSLFLLGAVKVRPILKYFTH